MTVLRHPTSALPRSVALAALSCTSSPVPERLDAGLRRVLAARIAAEAPGRHLGTLRLDSYVVLTPASSATRSGRPFAWSPSTARRLIGLAAARRVVLGASQSPLAAVRIEIADVIQRASMTHARPGALGSWLAEAPKGLVAAITAEAANYATDVVTLFDFDALGHGVEIGRTDPVWAVPGAPWVSLRARRDLEITLDAEQRTRALIALRPGRPGPCAVDDLSIVALADALSRPDAPMATRIVAVWPNSGRALSLEVDPEVMRRGARLVVDAVGVRARGTAPSLAA